MAGVLAHPLTLNQLGLLYDALRDGHPDRLIGQHRYRLSGPLAPERLAAAWRLVVDRHNALHSALRFDADGWPMLAGGPGAAAQPRWHDVSGRPAGERDRLVSGYLAADWRFGVDAMHAPAARLTVIRRDVHDHVLALTHHLLLLDGWSAELTVDRVLALAWGGATPAPGRSYRSYVNWLRGVDSRPAAAYWRREMARLPTPTDPRVATPIGREPDLIRAPLALPSHDRLAGLIAALGISTETLVATVWALALARFSGDTDVVFGVVREGRSAPFPGIDAVLGSVAAMVPRRLRVPRDTPAAEWLRRVDDAAAAAEPFASAPLPLIAGWSDMPAGQPLFRTVVSTRTGPRGVVRPDETWIDTGYPMTLTWAPAPAHAPEPTSRAVLQCRRDLVDDELPGAMAAYASAVVARLVDQPTVPLHELRTPDRPTVVLPDTRRPYDRTTGVVDLVAKQVRLHTDAIAVECREGTVTYAELDAAADRIAGRLCALGVGPEQLVGVCFDRSPQLVGALLGVLRAGGAYVPLDPELPEQRLRLLLRDTAARVVLADPALAATFPADSGCVVETVGADLARDWASWSGSRTRSHPESAAYVVYTSGSTGVPKGVVVRNSALTWLVGNTHYLDIDDRDVIALASNPAFDALTFECWVALTHGARLTVVPKETLLSPRGLGPALRERGATVLYVTAALLQIYAHEAPDFARGLRVLLFGGQVSDAGAVARVARESAPGRLIQVYGPTETTVWSAYQDVRPEHARIPLGVPIANTTMYVLDDDLAPVPFGVPGEIFIGGDGVTRGYLGQAARTAERFLPNPFGAGRLYRTGDRARLLPDGRFEFLGRTDDQVKIRGFRIELGEIAAAIQAHPDVDAAVVTVRAGAGGDQQLLAHIVPTGQTGPEPAELRTFLRSALPPYLIPSIYVPIDRLPLTPSGKVDRKALPNPPLRQGRVARSARAVRHAPTEPHAPSHLAEAVQQTWSAVFREGTGEEPYFELNADPAAALRLVALLRRRLDLEVTITDLLAAPTLAGLTATLQSKSPGRTR